MSEITTPTGRLRAYLERHVQWPRRKSDIPELEALIRDVAEIERAASTGIPGLRPMSEAPQDREFVAVTTNRAGCNGFLIVHWADGGGEDQPRFRGWFYWTGHIFAELPFGSLLGWVDLPRIEAFGRVALASDLEQRAIIAETMLKTALDERDRAWVALEGVMPLAKGYAPEGQSDAAKATCRAHLEEAESVLGAARLAVGEFDAETWADVPLDMIHASPPCTVEIDGEPEPADLGRRGARARSRALRGLPARGLCKRRDAVSRLPAAPDHRGGALVIRDLWTPKMEAERIALCERLLDHRSRLRARVSFHGDQKAQRLANDLQEAEAALTILGDIVAKGEGAS